ncbi:hypothetical protein LZ554_001015 [Drepanopeziza brunnea f. sp. 'monogermtubi']|nr:hypothetical protein LZ554_001015 [Drepanopeziza brunnea f. sp. 'monogermtubi']
MLRSKSLFAISLALGFLCSGSRAQAVSRDQEEASSNIIGYATLTEEEGRLLADEGALDTEAGRHYDQLGFGLYMISNPGNLVGAQGMWFCAIEADKKKIASMDKVYIPEAYPRKTLLGKTEQQYLWGQEEKLIVEYIEKAPFSISQPAKALRFSWNQASPWHLQMVIPMEAINDDDLGIQIDCFKSKEKLIDVTNEAINWEPWGIKGRETRGQPGFAPLS